MSMKIGDKVEYKSTDKSGNEKWRSGVIHGIKKAQDTNDNDIVLGYLVDTGKDEYSEEVTYDPRSIEITRRLNTELNKSKLEGDELVAHAQKTLGKIETSKDLPKSKLVTETVRQPEQVEVLPDDIRAVK